MIQAMEKVFRLILEEICESEFAKWETFDHGCRWNYESIRGALLEFESGPFLLETPSGRWKWQVARDTRDDTDSFSELPTSAQQSIGNDCEVAKDFANVNLIAHILCDQRFLSGGISTEMAQSLLDQYRQFVNPKMSIDGSQAETLATKLVRESTHFLVIPRATGRRLWTRSEFETIHDMTQEMTEHICDVYGWFDFVWSLVEHEGCVQVESEGELLLDKVACDRCFPKVLAATKATHILSVQQMYQVILVSCRSASHVVSMRSQLKREHVLAIVHDALKTVGVKQKNVGWILEELPSLLWTTFRLKFGGSQETSEVAVPVILDGESSSMTPSQLTELFASKTKCGEYALIVDDRVPGRGCLIFGEETVLGRTLHKYAVFLSKQSPDTNCSFQEIASSVYSSEEPVENWSKERDSFIKRIHASLGQGLFRKGTCGERLRAVFQSNEGFGYDVMPGCKFLYIPPPTTNPKSFH